MLLPLLALCPAPWSCAGGTAVWGGLSTQSRRLAEAKLHLSQPAAWMAATSASSAVMACSGLTAAALPDASKPSFQQLCRVVGSKWGAISADTLFKLRRGIPENDACAVLAFDQLFAAADMPEVAELITVAASKHKSFGSLAAALGLYVCD